jgi:hypothetical protein
VFTRDRHWFLSWARWIQSPHSHPISLRSVTNQPTSWSRVLEKLGVIQLLKNFPTFNGTWKFITAFTRASRRSLSWARCVQFIISHPVSLRSILILSPSFSGGIRRDFLPHSVLIVCCFHSRYASNSLQPVCHNYSKIPQRCVNRKVQQLDECIHRNRRLDGHTERHTGR